MKTEDLLRSYFPKTSELATFVKDPALSEANLSNMKALLDILVLILRRGKRRKSSRNYRRRKKWIKR